MPVIPNGWAQVVCHFFGNNAPHGAAIVFGVQNNDDLPANTVASRVYTEVAAIVDNLSSSDISFSTVTSKLGPNETGAIGSYTGATVTGAVGGTSLSPASCLLIEKSSLFGGRRSRGRMYWPGVYDGWADDSGMLTAGVPATIDTQLDNLRTGLAAAEVPMALLHTPSYTWEIVGGQPRRVYADPGTVPVPYLVNDLVVDPMIATQRRRLR